MYSMIRRWTPAKGPGEQTMDQTAVPLGNTAEQALTTVAYALAKLLPTRPFDEFTSGSPTHAPWVVDYLLN